MAEPPANPFEPPIHDSLGRSGTYEQLVSSLSTKSVVLGAVGILCCGIILGPLAITYANRAEAAIITSDQGHQHLGTIKTGRILGYLAIGLWFAAVLVRVALLISGDSR